MKFEYEMIFCIVNAGFSETVMEAAKESGAGGGTVFRRAAPPIKRLKLFSKLPFSLKKKWS